MGRYLPTAGPMYSQRLNQSWNGRLCTSRGAQRPQKKKKQNKKQMLFCTVLYGRSTLLTQKTSPAPPSTWASHGTPASKEQRLCRAVQIGRGGAEDEATPPAETAERRQLSGRARAWKRPAKPFGSSGIETSTPQACPPHGMAGCRRGDLMR